MRMNRTRGFLALTAVFGVAGFLVACGGSGNDDVAPPAPSLPAAAVTVDFAQSRGQLVHTERFNNIHTTSVYAIQRPSDIAYLNGQGMHGAIYRVWLNSPNEANVPPCAEDIATPQAAGKPCTLNAPFEAYLADADKAADKILANLRLDGTPGFITEGGVPAAVPLIERLLLAIKQAHPKLTYLEAWNEPDAPGTVIKPPQVYEYYVAAYRAVNNVNAALSATVPNYVPIQIGGPALYNFNKSWFAAFFDGYAADTDPSKRLDFISYHGYVEVDEKGTNVLLKGIPSVIAGQRAQIDAMLQARGISTDIPSYVTETGAYPGPSCDRCDSTDFIRGAVGMATLHYWFANEPKTYPFNWLIRQRAGGLKDQFVTKNAVGPYIDAKATQLWTSLNPVPLNTFTPFGNMLLMKSMMKDNRVAAQSDTLTQEGIGIYALAAESSTGASIMFWNHQPCLNRAAGCPGNAYETTISAPNLPANLRNRQVKERVFLIDQSNSNYYSDPARASLQQVSSRTFAIGSSYKNTLNLGQNAIYLILLEPAGS